MQIEIYSKTDCPYCQMAKQYLTGHGVAYTEHVYDDFAQRQEMYDAMQLTGSQRTVPQVFLIESDGQRVSIGGYKELIRSDVIARHHAGDFDEDF